jgi:lipopolysaccharide biosynthesis regulator YciM
VFAQFREEATRRVEADGVEQALQHALGLYQSGQVDAAVVTLERVSRVPALRFEAASTLATICRERGHTWQAIEWWERALEAPASSPDAGHRALHELADALESVGEAGRALAICLELQAEAGDYRDVAVRVARLARLQAQE